MARTLKDPEFHKWLKTHYSKELKDLKPQDAHNKFIVYLAWRQATHKQPPKTQEKHQPYLLDIN